MLQNEPQRMVRRVDPSGDAIPVRIMWPHCLRVRKSLLIAGAIALVLVITSLVVYKNTERNIQKELDQSAENIRNIPVPNQHSPW